MSKPPFPKTLSARQSWFETEEACVRYLVESRWPDGYACPRCGHREAYELTICESDRSLIKPSIISWLYERELAGISLFHVGGSHLT